MAPRALLLLSLAALAEGVLRLRRRDDFKVTCSVDLGGANHTEGSFTLWVHQDWAPKGAAQFRKLIGEGLYDNAGIFRMVPGFVAQFGLPAVPREVAAIEDDPVKHSNTRGTVVFATAGPNTRTSQLFINYDDNKDLDGMGFSPFGEVLEHGMEEVVDKFFSGYGEQADQGELTDKGDKYLQDNFPMMAKLRKCTVIQ
mmetsp:Transcript_112595/g.318530  ORF Transcript_112595/g.318530 Transcript_112595/m.318530 type:complete len:198 (+) Transcript_112595:66-659(+)